MSCTCRCHAYGAGTMITRDVDTGSSGVPGKPSCSPCDGGRPGPLRVAGAPPQPVDRSGAPAPVEQPVEGPAAAAERPVEPPPAPEPVPVERACVLPHPPAGAERAVGLLCARHYGELDGRLRELETLWALRDEVIVPGPSTGARVSGGGFGSPAPGRLSLMEVTDARAADDGDAPHVPRLLAFWAWEVCQARGIAVAAASLVTLSTSVGLLRRERRWIAAWARVGEYADALARAHRSLATATGASMWAEPVGRCPNCQTKLFNDLSGADVVACRRCKASWSGVAWLRLRLIFEQQEGKR